MKMYSVSLCLFTSTLVLGACTPQKSNTAKAEGAAQSEISIPVSVQDGQTKLAGMNIQKYEIAIEGCRSGFTSSTNQSSLKVILGDQGCLAVLRSVEIDGNVYIPATPELKNSVYLSFTAPNSMIRVATSALLSSPVAGTDTISFSLTQEVKKSDTVVSVGTQIEKSVFGEKAPEFDLVDVNFTSLDSNGHPEFSFKLNCAIASQGNLCGDEKVNDEGDGKGLQYATYEGDVPLSPEIITAGLVWRPISTYLNGQIILNSVSLSKAFDPNVGFKATFILKNAAGSFAYYNFSTIKKPEPLGLFNDCSIPGSGPFVADIYRIPTETVNMPAFENMTALNQFCMQNVNFAPQAFTAGFPGLPNLIEFFAMNIKTRLYISSPGLYSFKLQSINGAVLYINDEKKIDLDGIHALAAGEVEMLLPAGYHSINIRYFQAQRYEMGLILQVKNPGSLDYVTLNSKSLNRP